MKILDKRNKISVFSIKDDLNFVIRNRDKFIKKIGKENYKKLVSELKKKLFQKS